MEEVTHCQNVMIQDFLMDCIVQVNNYWDPLKAMQVYLMIIVNFSYNLF